jgi:hypothetical protein
MYIRHGVIGGPYPKANKKRSSGPIRMEPKKLLEEPQVIVVETTPVKIETIDLSIEVVEAVVLAPIQEEELDPILEEDKGYEPSEEFVEENLKLTKKQKKQKKLLKFTGESK